jgi:hypothetical protein
MIKKWKSGGACMARHSTKNSSSDGIKTLVDHRTKFVEKDGDYIEK